jgi:negative regulator of sigma E activity
MPTVSGQRSRRRANHLRLRLAFATLVVSVGILAGAPAAFATGVTYYAAPSATGLEDCSSATNACTLASALSDAAAATGDAVSVDLAAGTYAPISISSGGESTLTLDGAGEASTLLNGSNSAETVFLGASFPVELENLTIENGSNGGSDGGNVAVTAGNATISNASITGGSALHGAGIVVENATLTVSGSEISGNDAGTAGGGVMIFGGSTVTIRDSTLSGNTAGSAGGGIDLQSSSTLNLEDSTVTASTGGAILSLGSANVYGATIASNDSGIDVSTGTFDLGGSVLAANGGSHDCDSGVITDEGYNFADDASCSGFSGTSHASESSLDVGALAANGGPTESMRVPSSSEAYDVVPTGTTLTGDVSGAFCAGADQRGVARTQGPATACSAGAFQYAPPVVTGLSPRASLEPGLPVTLSGYGFANVTSVTFGGTAATITAQSATSLSFNVPLSLSLGSQPINVTNPDGTTAASFNAVGAPSVATSTLPPGQYKVAYSQSVAVAGGASPFTYTLTSGSLPEGLTLSSSGLVSGTPTKAGGSAFGVKITDANGITSSSALVSLVIATPVIAIKSASIVLSGSSAPVTLACASAPCSGTASLTKSVKVRVKGKLKTTALVLASVRYSLAAGQTATQTLVLTPAGLHALKHARKHPLKETLSVSLAAGTSASRTVKVS